MLSSNYKVEQPTSLKDFETYYLLRYNVLRKLFNQPFVLDETNKNSIHAFIKDKHIAIACGRLIFMNESTSQIKSMAVNPEYQRKGLGKKIISYLENISKESNRCHIFLHARESAINFYTKCGYNQKEKSYLMFGKIQHFLLEKTL